MKKYINEILIISAGIMWGTIGFFAKILTAYGFTSANNAIVRLAVAAVVLLIINRRHLKIDIRDLWKFALLGCSIFGTVFAYFGAIKFTSISVAAVLLYTAPMMVMVMSAALYHEKITKLKFAALAASFIGIMLVSGLGGNEKFGAKGIALGLLSGFSYSMYSIIGKPVTKKYNAYTITTYAFIFAAALSLIFGNLPTFISTVAKAHNKLLLILVFIATGAVTAGLPYMLYTLGLKNVPAGKAAVIASAEPLTAAVIGTAVFHESLTVLTALGMILIICSVAALSLEPTIKQNGGFDNE